MRTATVALLLALGISAQAAEVKRPSKEFTIAPPGGQQILLSSMKGKVCVVQFLFTWCPHCQAFSQVLTQLSQQYGPRGFQALGVAFEDDVTKEKVIAYTRQYAGFPVGMANRSTVFNYLGLSELQRIGVPQIVVIDRKGVIQEQTEAQGGGKLGDVSYLGPLIDSLLKEGAAPAKAAPANTKKTVVPKKTS